MSNRSQGKGGYVEDDDDGWGSKSKWVPPSQRGDSSNQELEDELKGKSDALTDDTMNLLKITEQTKGVAGQTLVTLKDQGEQIDRIHHKTVQTEQELQKGETLLSKLGGMFSMGYKPKKGKAVTGPKDYGDDKKSRSKGDKGSREKLGLEGEKKPKKKEVGSRPNTEGMNGMQKFEADKQFQDEVLDAVIGNLDGLSEMAKEMGNEMDRQDKKLDDLNADITEVDSRMKQANKRAGKLLGKK